MGLYLYTRKHLISSIAEQTFASTTPTVFVLPTVVWGVMEVETQVPEFGALPAARSAECSTTAYAPYPAGGPAQWRCRTCHEPTLPRRSR
jgi:hypothetical protein